MTRSHILAEAAKEKEIVAARAFVAKRDAARRAANINSKK